MIKADKKSVCCIAKTIRSCIVAIIDVFTGCENLLDNLVLKIVVWIVAAGSFLFNIIAFLYRIFRLKQISSQNFLLINLAASDILLSLYLIMLSIVNVVYQGIFIAISYDWRQSATCIIMAILSSVSSNMSIYILATLAFLRAMNVLFHYKVKELHTVIVTTFGWLANLLLSLLTVYRHFYLEGNMISNDACILYSPGPGNFQRWIWTFSFFILPNLLLIIVISSLYGSIIKYTFQSWKKMEKLKAVTTKRSRTTTLISVGMLTCTNVLTWIPILILSLLSISGVPTPATISRYLLCWYLLHWMLKFSFTRLLWTSYCISFIANIPTCLFNSL